jgi:hypothetical protein
MLGSSANPAAILALLDERDSERAARGEAEAERDVVAGVLCVIHRDGGHYIGRNINLGNSYC